MMAEFIIINIPASFLVVSLDVSPVGLVEALPQLLGHFKDLPRVVMLQKWCLLRQAHENGSSPAKHSAYCVMAVQGSREESVSPDDSTALIQVVTFCMHI